MVRFGVHKGMNLNMEELQEGSLNLSPGKIGMIAVDVWRPSSITVRILPMIVFSVDPR